MVFYKISNDSNTPTTILQRPIHFNSPTTSTSITSSAFQLFNSFYIPTLQLFQLSTYCHILLISHHYGVGKAPSYEWNAIPSPKASADAARKKSCGHDRSLSVVKRVAFYNTNEHKQKSSDYDNDHLAGKPEEKEEEEEEESRGSGCQVEGLLPYKTIWQPVDFECECEYPCECVCARSLDWCALKNPRNSHNKTAAITHQQKQQSPVTRKNKIQKNQARQLLALS